MPETVHPSDWEFMEARINVRKGEGILDENKNTYMFGNYSQGVLPLTSEIKSNAKENTVFPNAQVLTTDGFKPLSKEERDEAARIAAEAGFSFDGYQVVRREFFSHKFDPTLTIKGNSITFNNACISRLDQVVYVQVLVNPDTEKLVIRPCSEGARDAIRWCIAKDNKRKSRQITCGLFTAKLYEMMGWEALYRYKLQGTKISYQGEQLYVFDLTSTEIFLPQTKDPENPDARPKRRPPVYPADWRDSFGLPVEEHAASMKINLYDGYGFEGDYGKSAEMEGTVASTDSEVMV